jgi:hypothetical protein
MNLWLTPGLGGIYNYYSLIKVSVVGSMHSVKLLMFVPIKKATQQSSIFRIVPVPNKIEKDNYIMYQLDHTHFVLAEDRRDYALLNKAGVMRCTVTNAVTVYPVHTAVYDVHTLTCVSSLSFQMHVEVTTCQRTIRPNYDVPMLERYADVWVYHFPQPTRVTIRCPKNDGSWETVSEVLQGSGPVTEATMCHFKSTRFILYLNCGVLQHYNNRAQEKEKVFHH